MRLVQILTNLANAKLSPFTSSCCRLSTSFINKCALIVYDPDPVETIEHIQIRRHPQFKKYLDQSYSNYLGCIFQVVGESCNSSSQCVKVTDTLHVIRFRDVPDNCPKEFNYTKVVY